MSPGIPLLSSKPLSARLHRAWRDQGFLVLPGTLSAAGCARLRQRAATLIAERRGTAPPVVFETATQRHARDDAFAASGDDIQLFFEEDDPTAVNKIGHALHRQDPVFAPFSQQHAVLALLRALGMAVPRLVQSMYLCKAPGVGGAVSPHQDGTFLQTEPDSVIGLWLALHDAHRDNGCLWALPGAHREPLRARFGRQADGTLALVTHDPRPWPLDSAVPLEVSAGTLVVLHGQLPHYSAPNRSAQPREAYALHAVDGTARWLPENWLPPPQ